jgi:signal transduction histidine kinase
MFMKSGSAPESASSKGVNPGPTPAPKAGSRLLGSLFHKFSQLLDRQVPPEFFSDPEATRRGRLMTGFGVLGPSFGLLYTLFYLAIGHKWGAIIVFTCSTCVALTPSLMRWKKSVEVAGHFFALILTLGFLALCFVEGGQNGHAIAWLVSIPLCCFILLGERQAACWVVISIFAAGIIICLDLEGIKLTPTYDPKWQGVVSAAGYLGLMLFMFILGLIFERGRRTAFAKLEETLSKLAASNEHLVHLNNEKNELMGIAAHDLKNPLTVVLGNAELMVMTKDPNMIAKLSQNTRSVAIRMRDLIANLLDVNAIEQGKFIVKVERCNIQALIEQSLEHNQSAANRKKSVFKVGISEGLWAKADRAGVMQILDNLISNALKYSPPNTTVHVHALPEKDHVAINVRDEGPGISEADQKKLFRKFTRLTARPTGGESSTGLGLAIVKKLAEAMSGTVQCRSALGAGSTFILRLPVSIEKEEPKEQSPDMKIPGRSVVELPGAITGMESRN